MIRGLLMLLLFGPPPQAGTFKVSGTVVRADKLDPATVTLSNQVRISGPITMVGSIGPGGAFEFSNIAPGTYQIVVGPRITMSPLTVVVSDKDVTNVRVVVPLTLEVAGTVSVEGGGPRPRFQIAFTPVEGSGAKPVTLAAGTSFRAAVSAGQYRMTATGLPAGYTLKSAMFGDVDVLTQPLRVGEGSLPTISITLAVSSPPPWVRVSGRVIGGTATNVTMNGTAMAEPLTAPVGPDGAFEFPMVLPGNYTARTVPAMAVVPPVPVTVGTTNVTNVEVRIPATKEVTGKITTSGNVSAPRLVLSLANGPTASATNAPAPLTISGGVVLTTAGTVSVPTNAGPDGSFRISLPEGERAISIVPSSIPQGFSVDSFTYGSQDLLKSPIRVALNDTAEIAITVDATRVEPRNVSGKVTGLLTNRGVRVVLQGGNLGTGVESPVAADGSFGFSNILPGTYSARLSLSGHVISTSVAVGNNDVTNLMINYPRQFSIAAHVVVEGDTVDPPPIPSVALEARSATGVVVGSSGSVTNLGPMVLTIADGEHRISVKNVPAGYVLKSLRYGTLDLQESPVIVDGPITWEIVVRLVKTGK